MDLVTALRTTAATREFQPDPVPHDVLARVLDTARFAPSGGNSQGWRVVVVEDAEKRRQLRDLYLQGWYEYRAMAGAGLRPWSPLNDRGAEREAAAGAGALAAEAAAEAGTGGFAEHLDQVPVLLALFVDLGALAAVDRDLDRYTFAGGASVYPFAWNLLLAARSEGLGGVMTTMNIRAEPEAKELLRAPEHLALAAVIALGFPTLQPQRLTRAAVESFTTMDSVDGPPFGSAQD
jgi:nitroreductase